MSIGLYTLHEEQIKSRGLSTFVQEVLQDVPVGGLQFFEDFVAADANDRFTAYVGTSAVQAEEGGVRRLTSSTTDGNNVAVRLANLLKLDKKTAVEIRLKKASVTNGSVFVGLTSDTIAAGTGPLGDGNVDHGISHEGIGVVINAETDGDAANLSLCGSDSSKAATKGSAAVAADTYIKLGFLYDPAHGAYLYADGVRQTEYHIPSALSDSTKAPASSSLLDLLILFKASSTGATTLDYDWIAVAQAAS